MRRPDKLLLNMLVSATKQPARHGHVSCMMCILCCSCHHNLHRIPDVTPQLNSTTIHTTWSIWIWIPHGTYVLLGSSGSDTAHTCTKRCTRRTCESCGSSSWPAAVASADLAALSASSCRWGSELGANTCSSSSKTWSTTQVAVWPEIALSRSRQEWQMASAICRLCMKHSLGGQSGQSSSTPWQGLSSHRKLNTVPLTTASMGPVQLHFRKCVSIYPGCRKQHIV